MKGIGTHNEFVRGVVVISEDNWIWAPESMKQQNIQQLSNDIRFIRKVNPASGLTFMRHIKKADKCDDFLDDSEKFSKCVIHMNKIKL